MKPSTLILVLASPLLLNSLANAADITGAGSTFVFPLISKWADAYKKETGNSVNYQSIGSGGGIKQIENKTVDFGATDMPLKPEELKTNNLVQFPIVNGALVAVINLKTIKNAEMKLTGPLLADIFLGKIKKWNDPAIAEVNKGVVLPTGDITVVHRAEGSGTSFVFTNYLSKVSSDWKTKVGEGTAVNWPVGVSGKGNEGVASYVKQIEGSIGYVEYAFAMQNNMTTTQLKNADGKFVTAGEESFAAAASHADWKKAENYYLILTNAAGKASWPIAGSTFVLMQKVQSKPEQGTETIKFFRWAFAKGETMAKDLKYVPLPKSLETEIEKTWKNDLQDASGAKVASGQ